MNMFRLAADAMHLLSILILLLKIQSTRSASGISYKTQLLYTIVFCARYLDLIMVHMYISLYNTVMKLIFISSSFYILYLMKSKYRSSWDPNLDTFRIEFLIVGSFVLGLLFHVRFTFLEILWSFSIFLESVAILPQLFQMTRTGEAETITSHYIFALGAYRALYLANWIYRFFTESHFTDWISVSAGFLQTVFYMDFFYIYFTR
jgi:ER lumen protein retaining receptor